MQNANADEQVVERERIVERKPARKSGRNARMIDEEIVVYDDGNAEVEGRGAVRPLYRGTQVIWYLFWILEMLLVLRFFLRLLGANPSAGFTDFIYTITAPFVAPFIAVFGATEAAGSVIEWTTLLAMFVYWLLAYAVASLFVIGRPVNEREAQDRLSKQERSSITP